MDILKLVDIKDLAQNFLRAPRISKIDDGLFITYDYEMDTGEYGEKSIIFENALDFRHISESDITPDMIKAYNSIGVVVNSDWINDRLIAETHKHYIIYFDEYGAYEIIAKNFKLSG